MLVSMSARPARPVGRVNMWSLTRLLRGEGANPTLDTLIDLVDEIAPLIGGELP